MRRHSDRARTHARCLLLQILLWAGIYPAAAGEYYVFDKPHTVLGFAVARLGGGQITGSFADYEGQLILCAEHPENDAVAITLSAASVRTASVEIDRTLKGQLFFDVERYPQIGFRSQKTTVIDARSASIEGNLSMLGTARPMTLRVRLLDRYFDLSIGRYAARLSADAVIERSRFGMGYLIPIIGDAVRLHIDATTIAIAPISC